MLLEGFLEVALTSIILVASMIKRVICVHYSIVNLFYQDHSAGKAFALTNDRIYVFHQYQFGGHIHDIILYHAIYIRKD